MDTLLYKRRHFFEKSTNVSTDFKKKKIKVVLASAESTSPYIHNPFSIFNEKTLELDPSIDLIMHN